MKIVHAVYSLELGGAEVLVAQLCRIQRAHGHDVSVCAYSGLGAVGEALQTDGFDVYVPGEAHPAKTMLRYFRLFRRIKPDVVHCHNVAPTLQAALSARLAGVRCIVSTRHSLVAPPYDRAEEIKYSLMATFCDWIAGICETTCVNLRGAPWSHRKKIVCVYNGAASLERVSAEALGKVGFTVLFVGRLAAIKDLPTLIRAASLAVERVSDIQLWIVGDGPVRVELQALSRELGVEQRVRFFGQQMETDRYFSAADCFAMSSISEGLPMSLLQAMSLGLPTVVTDVGGMAEVVQLADCGLTTPVGDPQAMANALVRLAGDRGLRAEFSRHALAAYEAQFTLERMDEAYMMLYRGASKPTG